VLNNKIKKKNRKQSKKIIRVNRQTHNSGYNINLTFKNDFALRTTHFSRKYILKNNFYHFFKESQLPNPHSICFALKTKWELNGGPVKHIFLLSGFPLEMMNKKNSDVANIFF
jgi:hypothetical protein